MKEPVTGNTAAIQEAARKLSEMQLQQARLLEQLEAVKEEEQAISRQFKHATETGKRRIVSQVLRLRREAERKRQLNGMIGMQMSVIETQIHNLSIQLQAETGSVPIQDLVAGQVAAKHEVEKLTRKAGVTR
jgi:hypothetical protein